MNLVYVPIRFKGKGWIERIPIERYRKPRKRYKYVPGKGLVATDTPEQVWFLLIQRKDRDHAPEVVAEDWFREHHILKAERDADKLSS